MKVKEVLKKLGVKNAETQIDPRTHNRSFYEPKLPAKLQEKVKHSGV